MSKTRDKVTLAAALASAAHEEGEYQGLYSIAREQHEGFPSIWVMWASIAEYLIDNLNTEQFHDDFIDWVDRVVRDVGGFAAREGRLPVESDYRVLFKIEGKKRRRRG